MSTVSNSITIEQWHPFDLLFTSADFCSNPFLDVSICAEFSGPNGATLTLPGFYNGNNNWIVRFSPTRVGNWTYTTISNEAQLNAKTGKLTCVANTLATVHGRLFVDPSNPHHLKYEDGTPYFMMGAEINWLCLIQCNDGTLTKAKQIIDLYGSHGFTQFQINAYAWDTDWKNGKTCDDDFGPPDMYAWEGTNESPDHSRLNTAYWDHFDKVIDYLFLKGIVAHIYLKVYNKKVNWPANGSKYDILFFSTVVSRYQAYPNIIWSFSKESYNEPDHDYIHQMLDLISNIDAYKRLRTTHDDVGKGIDYSADPAYNHNIYFRTVQNTTDIYTNAIHYRNNENWPVYNAEYGYEIGNDGGYTFSSIQSKEETFKRTCEVLMAGAYPAYYYTYHAWDVVRTYEVPDGLIYYKNLAGFFNRTKWLNLVPCDNLIGNKPGYHCLAKAGFGYMVYFSCGGSVVLAIASATGRLHGFWMNAFTGQEQPAGPFENGSRILSAPWPDVPSLLWIS